MKDTQEISKKTKLVKDVLKALKSNGFYSYDLCDIQQLPYFTFIYNLGNKSKFGKGIVLVHKTLLNRYSSTFRKILGIKKQKFAQSQSFIIRAYLLLKKIENTDEYDSIIKDETKWILAQANKDFKNLCWGQPYNWVSAVKTIPANTPRTTVTSQIIHCLLDVYATFGEENYLKDAISAGQFFVDEMPKSYINSHNIEISLSYTTLDQLMVYNANMMACGALSRLYKYAEIHKFKETATGILNFTMNRQNEDGSWYYHDQGNKSSKIDNFHTGYILEGILHYKDQFGLSKTHSEKLKAGIEYYIDNLFSKDMIPKYEHNRKYPLDIQCLAQSIITNTKLNNIESAESIYLSASNNFYNEKANKFAFRIYESGRKDENNYIRWGDSWMCFAIALLAVEQTNNTNSQKKSSQ